MSLDAASDRFAVGLSAPGLLPGDALGLQQPDIPQILIADVGILEAGCVVVPMDVLFEVGAVGHLPQDSRVRMIVERELVS
ncbi:hypothetical protein GCM10027451_51750 [Geodermatophilus aquaeductus]|uniref:AMP-binding enzyme n=1 Tax=Geodermatophilus aquaeductus TaxID=1564161 RepID=A0A521FV02_9ACTN|nr:AMP-binding protein [Geodermatophilus aquaeductus]SMP00035.1 AMP-binding enzyme [Geodermatophilus aquaeductus]